MAIAFALVASRTRAPTGTPNLPATVFLHGSWFPLSTYGDLWEYTYPQEFAAYPGIPIKGQFTVEEASGRITVRPMDTIISPKTGLQFRCFWVGVAETGRANRFVERRLDEIIEHCVQYYHLDRERIACNGNSLGGRGTLTYGLCRQTFSVLHPHLPDWDIDRIASFEQIEIPSTVPMLDEDGSSDFWPTIDCFNLLDDGGSRKIPWLMWSIGQYDGNMPWTDHLRALDILRRTKRAHAFCWTAGNHGGAGYASGRLQQDYPLHTFRRNQSYPAFFNSSIDDDPTIVQPYSPSGAQTWGINMGFRWRNIVDAAGIWSCEISNTRATGDMTVEVLPYNCQTFSAHVDPKLVTIPHGQWAAVAFEETVPLPVDCELSAWGEWFADSEWSECVAGQQTRTERRTRTIVVHPQNGGEPCGPLEETRIVSQPCAVTPTLTIEPMNLSLQYCFRDWHYSSRYERFQRLRILTKPIETLAFHCVDFNAGGVDKVLPEGTYTLTVDGMQRATCVITGTTTKVASFALENIGLFGHVMLRFSAPDGTQSLPFWVFVNPGGSAVPAQAVVPVQAGSYDVVHGSPFAHGFLPTGMLPTPKPLALRDVVPFDQPLHRSLMHRSMIVPQKVGNIHRPNINAQGINSTANYQYYAYFELERQIPKVHLLDGPRGIGTLGFATHLMVDRHGGAYCCDPWRVVRVSQEGVVRTRCGYRHRYPPSQYDTPSYDLVGDWSGVPENLRGFWEIWGADFWTRTLALDDTVPPIGGEQPHQQGPQLFVTSSKNGTVYRLTFQKDSFEAEPKVTVFATGLSMPWEVIEVDDVVYVSERDANRIAKYDAASGAHLGTLLDCPRVDGLYHYDGWLYFGSLTTKLCERYNLTTGVRETLFSLKTDNNSKYVKLAVGDGSFGPAGTVFYATWSNAPPYPRAVLPSGQEWFYYAVQTGGIPQGKGGGWRAPGYATAMAVGMGRLYVGSAQEGLHMLSQALPSDPTIDMARYNAGESEYEAKGYRYLYGEYGYGYHGLELPFGESENIDYFLMVCGHG